jgi:hypothetical protein
LVKIFAKPSYFASGSTLLHQHFWCQAGEVFAQIIFTPFKIRQNLVKNHKIMAACAKFKTSRIQQYFHTIACEMLNK